MGIFESSRKFIANEGGERTKFFLRLNLEPFINLDKLEVRGQESLEKLPPERTVIFAVTHLDDLSVQAIGYWLMEQGYDAYLTQQSAQRKISEAAPLALLMRVIGWERFFPIGSRTVKGQIKGTISYSEYKDIAHKAPHYIVIAAHNPVKAGEGAQLPEKAGLAAPLAAIATGGVIVPVSIDIQGPAVTFENPLSALRRPATISFGEPVDWFQDQSAEAVVARDRIHQQILGYEPETKLPKDYLRQLGGDLMGRLAMLLPVSKRGIWNQDLSQSET